MKTCPNCGHDLVHIGDGYYCCSLNSMKYPLTDEKFNEYLQCGLWHPGCLKLQRIG